MTTRNENRDQYNISRNNISSASTSHNDQVEDKKGQTPTKSANSTTFQYYGNLTPINTSLPPALVTHRASPLSAELRIKTDLWPADQHHAVPSPLGHRSRLSQEMYGKNSLPVRSSSVKSLGTTQFAAGSRPGSNMSSPNLGPLSDITPLPSPVSQSPGPWSRTRMSGEEPRPERGSSEYTRSTGTSPPKKRKAFPEKLTPAPDNDLSSLNATHGRHRSFSEYVAATNQASRPRNVAVSGTQTPSHQESSTQPMQREEYLAVQRGISSIPTPRPLTPPESNKSVTSDAESPPPNHSRIIDAPIFDAPMLKNGKTRQWVGVRLLGTGSFSRVMLATSDLKKAGSSEEELNSKTLVAIKVCEHGPAGGADEKRIEESLKREIEILKAISHPSLVHLKAVNILEKRAYLVLSYCAGGDMFELASEKLQLLTPSLVRRIFSELVAAVHYLHGKLIVHRDIKLENVLMNVRLTPENSSQTDWQTYPYPVVTLTDLGLGRFLPPPPASQLLTTQCGSEDYAAPELLMGQEYDGRMTDAWALGVLLYATMEGRLPFDPIPGARRQSPTSHRIARCEWSWVKYSDADGEWDEEKGAELAGARSCVESLLRRVRTRSNLEQIAQRDWVKSGICVAEGLSIPELQ